jgi:hypothetical protein
LTNSSKPTLLVATAAKCQNDFWVLSRSKPKTFPTGPVAPCQSWILCEPANKDLCFLGRKGKFSECGLYSMNLRSPAIQQFLSKFQWMYDNAEDGIFKLAEWHDSFVFDAVRNYVKTNELDWSSHLVTGEGHPLINSEWGAWLDHLKGGRKDLGKSKRTDLLVKRSELYWQQFS